MQRSPAALRRERRRKHESKVVLVGKLVAVCDKRAAPPAAIGANQAIQISLHGILHRDCGRRLLRGREWRGIDREGAAECAHEVDGMAAVGARES